MSWKTVLRLLLLGSCCCLSGPGDSAVEQRHAPCQEVPTSHERTLRKGLLASALKLDEAGAKKVSSVLGQYDVRLRELAVEHAEIVVALDAEVVATKPDATTLLVLMERLLANERQRQVTDHDRWHALRPSLQVWQQGRLLLVLPHIERTLSYEGSTGRIYPKRP